MAVTYTSALVDQVWAYAIADDIANFNRFTLGKPEHINFDHNMDFGDYSGAWAANQHDNSVAHDFCLMTYPKSTVTDVDFQRQHYEFSLYACRLLSDTYVKSYQIHHNFAGLDFKLWKMLMAMHSCDNKVLDTSFHRDLGLFNDKLMVVRCDVMWEMNSICEVEVVNPPNNETNMVVCVDRTGTYVYPANEWFPPTDQELIMFNP